jgi:hypothetical protein
MYIGTVEKLFCTALYGHGKRDARNAKALLKCGMWKNLKHGTSFDGSFFLFFSFLSSSVKKCKHALVDGGGYVVHADFFDSIGNFWLLCFVLYTGAHTDCCNESPK